MNNEQIVEATAEHVRVLFQGEGSGHDWWHIYRVWQSALHIAEQEQVDLVVVQLAALLHDIADWKFHDGDETAGSRAARAWLESLQVDEAVIAHVCDIIGHLSFKGAEVRDVMPTREGMVVQDADRLDAVGAIGIARAFAYGGFKHRELYDPAVTPRLHATFEEYKTSQGTTINHFYEKLLLLEERIHTCAAREIARARHIYMEQFLEQFFAEWQGER